MSSPSSSDQAPRKEVVNQPTPSIPSNTFTNISAGDDSRQLIVSTTGVIIQAAGITTGQRTAQGMGQMSDQSIEMLLRHNASTTSKRSQGKETTSPSWEHYGTGHGMGDYVNQTALQ
jgi:hypothetical protein